jgi:hypothetical protein
MSTSYVVEGAKIKCSQGIGESVLKSASDNNVKLHDQTVLTVADTMPNVNIMPFEGCKSNLNPAVAASTTNTNGMSDASTQTALGVGALLGAQAVLGTLAGNAPQAPCNPSICMKWLSSKEDVILNGEGVLTSDSTLTCMYNGKIEIIDDGQRKG